MNQQWEIGLALNRRKACSCVSKLGCLLHVCCLLTAVTSVATGIETAATCARAPSQAQEHQDSEIAACQHCEGIRIAYNHCRSARQFTLSIEAGAPRS